MSALQNEWKYILKHWVAVGVWRSNQKYWTKGNSSELEVGLKLLIKADKVLSVLNEALI